MGVLWPGPGVLAECPRECAARPVWFRQAAATPDRLEPQARVELCPELAAGREEERLVLARDYIAVRAFRRFPSVASNLEERPAYSAESVECVAALSAARGPGLKRH